MVGYVLARWQRNWSVDKDASLQVYYDRHDLDDIALSVARNTIDVEGQFNVHRGRQDWVFGGGYRFSADQTEGSEFPGLRPSELNFALFSAFIQDI
ncbi:MAG: hypothetical protein ACI906_002407 [Candidatus Latescibacterota bacterium]|jgi:hypothetical protein